MHFTPILNRFIFLRMRAVYALVILCECVNLVRVENSVDPDQMSANLDLQCFKNMINLG